MKMKTYQIVLASASPRRCELLKQIGMDFSVLPSQREEKITTACPKQAVQELSAQKAEDVFSRLSSQNGRQAPPFLVIGADTIVVCDDRILGKPADEADACRMLSLLQGRSHQVYTGVTVITGEERFTFYECTRVEFYPMSEQEIKAYAATKEPMDKAGAYGIQGRCAAYIKGIQGDYNNVVGLPAGRLYQELRKRNLWQGPGMSHEKKAVIFDLDGTLCNTLESLSYCTNRALADFGFPALPTESFQRFVGNGAQMQIARALRAAGDAEAPGEGEKPDEDGFFTQPAHLLQVLEKYLQYFEKDCMYHVKPYAGIRKLLETLKEKGTGIAVFSNKPHENTVDVIETLFGKGYFDVIQGQTPSMNKKPAPDGVFAILSEMGLRAGEILYAGDSCVDMDTGRAAGVQTIGVLWGYRDREELLQHGANALIEKPEELLEYL